MGGMGDLFAHQHIVDHLRIAARGIAPRHGKIQRAGGGQRRQPGSHVPSVAAVAEASWPWKETRTVSPGEAVPRMRTGTPRSSTM